VINGEARAEVGNLPVSDPATRGSGKAMHWRVNLRALDHAKSRPDVDDQVDFRVFKGVTEPAAQALATRYLFAFEIVSVLLLAALVGAAFLARKEVKET
jgi:hypothetical protein